MNYYTTVNDSDARMTRGLALLQINGKCIIENVDGSFAVPSQTSSKTYEVRLLGDRYVYAPVLILSIGKAYRHVLLYTIAMDDRMPKRHRLHNMP